MHSFEVLGRATGIPKGLKKKKENSEREGGLVSLEFGGQGGV